jgi:hypothetical protein
VKVIVSRAGDHAKAPVVTGLVEKADSTLRVSIGWLNRITIGVVFPTFVESCAGVMLVTTGSSGSICDCPPPPFTDH